MALVCLAAWGAPARAVLQDYDPFDYAGTALNGQTGGTGWTGGWFTTGTVDNTLSDDNVSLTYPVTFASPLGTPAASGDRVQTGGLTAIASSSRMLSQTIDLSQDGNVRYVSALFKKTAPNGDGVNNDNILLEFVDSLGNRRWGMGITGNGDLPWLNANGSGSPATSVVPGETYFMVAKIVSSTLASGDAASLWVFGSGYASQVPVAEPTPDFTLTETTAAILDRIRIRIDPGNTSETPGQVDEIRIGDTWASVTNGVDGIPGDFNGDQKVDDVDFGIWQNDFGTSKDGEDFLVWQANYGTGVPQLGAVPEPGAAALAAVALIGLACRGRGARAAAA
jgi:hypothetical protein